MARASGADRTRAPAPVVRGAEPPLPLEKDGAVAAYANADDDNVSQAGALYRPMNEDPKAQLVANIAGGLWPAAATIQQRMVEQFRAADPDDGARVERALAGRRASRRRPAGRSPARLRSRISTR